jgi:hypothetical protein
MVSRATGVAIAAMLAAAPVAAVAQPQPCDPVIERTLAVDARRARTWNLGWGLTFAAAAVGTAGFAAFAPDDWDWVSDDFRAGLYVTSAKATLGALSRAILPLRVPADASCATPSRVRLAKAAKRERRNIILNTVGGFAVNTAGLLYLGLERDAWSTGWVGFGVGTAVGVASTLTAPRWAWAMQRDLVAAPIVGPDFSGFAIAGTW